MTAEVLVLLQQMAADLAAIRKRLDSPLSPDAAQRLSACQRDVYGVLTSGGRMTGPEILTALARRGIRWSDITVWRALAHLVRLGMVRNSKRKPQGYWIPEGQTG